jgi:hypothetical protein
VNATSIVPSPEEYVVSLLGQRVTSTGVRGPVYVTHLFRHRDGRLWVGLAYAPDRAYELTVPAERVTPA